MCCYEDYDDEEEQEEVEEEEDDDDDDWQSLLQIRIAFERIGY